MPGSVDNCWTIPCVCTKGDFGPLQRHSYSPISDWWHRVYIELWGPAMYHACPTVSITFKDFTWCQIVLHNPSVNLEIVCTFIHPPINCIRNTDFLWSIFPVTIFHSLSLMLDKVWECLASSFNVQCLFYPAFLHFASYPSMCFGPLSRVFPVFQIYSNRKLTDPHFQQKMSPISIHPCQYVKLQNAQKKLCFRQQLDACRQKAPLRSCAFVLRSRHCIYRAYQVKYSSCSCEPSRLLPLSLHAQADTQAVLAQSHHSPSTYQ